MNAGVSQEQIDYVLCTHHHIDHCGWNTRSVDGHWTPTFPNARYIIARREFEAAQFAADDPDDRPMRTMYCLLSRLVELWLSGWITLLMMRCGWN
jgi:glyoxylase-like metal-dependent hydrolase (beta-lactamase superfamily II)